MEEIVSKETNFSQPTNLTIDLSVFSILYTISSWVKIYNLDWTFHSDGCYQIFRLFLNDT